MVAVPICLKRWVSFGSLSCSMHDSFLSYLLGYQVCSSSSCSIFLCMVLNSSWWLPCPNVFWCLFRSCLVRKMQGHPGHLKVTVGPFFSSCSVTFSFLLLKLPRRAVLLSARLHPQIFCICHSRSLSRLHDIYLCRSRGIFASRGSEILF